MNNINDTEYPFSLFRFRVEFQRVEPANGSDDNVVEICKGAFSECTGLEATMEPKVIKAGGWNYGSRQRSGPVTFGTVILKRGITTNRNLWTWFSFVNEMGYYAFRLNVKIYVSKPGKESSDFLKIHLKRALPVKFKFADLNARASDISIEELHLVHEGLTLE